MTAGLTIIVLTRDRRELLRGCLESLLAQEDPGAPLEFIVVDDGSRDGSAEMARQLTASRPEWRTVTQAPAGIAAARNAGIRRCRTEWLAIVADDYVLPADYARTVVSFFRGNPGARVVRFRVAYQGGDFLGRLLHASREAGMRRQLGKRAGNGEALSEHGLEASGAAAFHAEVFRRLGGFDESYARGEDSEFTRRLRAAGIAVHYLPRMRIGHRQDPGLRAALRNAFLGGEASWRLAPHGGRAGIVAAGLRSLAAIPYWACWRAWRAGGAARFLPYLPVLLLVEAAARAGYFAAGLRRRREDRCAGPRHP